MSASGVDPLISEANARDPGAPRRRACAASPLARVDAARRRQHRRPLRSACSASRASTPPSSIARSTRRPHDDRGRHPAPDRRSRGASKSLFSPEHPAAARSARSSKLDPRVQVRNPVMFVVEVGAVITTIAAIVGGGEDPRWFTRHDRHLAVADGGLRQPRRGAGRGPRQGAGRDAARDALRDDRAPARTAASVAASELRKGDVVRRRRRRGHPRRRHRHRGHRLRRRVGDHGRVGAGHPRVRRRPQRGHRRHAGALRPDRGRDHAGAGQVVPGPHDRAGRGRRAAQDAERDRAEHPARRADAGLPVRRRDAAAVRGLRRTPTSRSRR